MDHAKISGLMRAWRAEAGALAWMHGMAARVHCRNMYLIGTPTVLITTVVGTTIFTAAATNKSADLTIQLLTGLFSIGASVLASLGLYLNYPKRTEEHRKASLAFRALCDELDLAFAIGEAYAFRDEARVEKFRTEFIGARAGAPQINPRIERKWKRDEARGREGRAMER